MAEISLNQKIFDLSSKVSIVTGGGRGIGNAIAEGFRKSGSKVVILDKEFPLDYHDEFIMKTVDMGSEAEIDKTVFEINDELKRIDVLVNCAGITIPNKSHEYTSDDWLKTMDVNLNGIFFISKLVGNIMIDKKIQGSIINLTSIGGEQGFPNNPAYCSAKGAIKQLTKALAYDWGEYGIRVNNLVPGYTNTPMNIKSWEDRELREQRASSTMLKRWGETEEFIGPAIFLASDASSYVTGSDLVVDGGWLAKGI